MTTDQMQALFDSIICGEIYKLNLGGQYSMKPWRSKEYIIHNKKKHNEYVFSFFCQANEPEGGVIYHWLTTPYHDISERIISMEKINATN